MTRGETAKANPLRIVKILFLGFWLYAIFVPLFSRSLADYDLWGYLSFGRVFWTDGYFPFHDPFSYMPTRPLWVYHEWLTGLIFYFIHHHAGPAGLQLLRYILVLLTIYLMYFTAIKRGAGTLFSLFALLPAMLLISFGYVPVRAQIFTYFFFMLTLALLESARKGQRWAPLVWLLPIQILWCNLHGGFVAGLGLIALYILGEGLSGKKFMPYIAVIIPATLATLINPYGIAYWAYTIRAIAMPRPEIDEWMSVITALQHHIQDVPVFLFLFFVLLCLVLLLFQRKRSLTDGLVVAMVIYLGATHIRHTIFFGLILGSHVPLILSEYWKVWQERGFRITHYSFFPQSVLAVFLLSFYLAINPSLSVSLVPSFSLETPAPDYPIGALHWMEKNHLRGNILPHFDWGEFLIWRCYPACRVAMDGRYETVYEEAIHREYFDFLMGRSTGEMFLKRYPHDMVLIKPSSTTHMLMLRESAWQVAYADSSSMIFVRKTNKEGIPPLPRNR
jgi:hypothetical protein